MSEFVTIDIAKKLKEKGFPQGNKDDITEKYYTISDSLTSAVMSANGEDVKWYCPTIGQVLKWLREKDLMVEITPSLGNDGTWTFSYRVHTKKFISRIVRDFSSLEDAAFSSYEDAALDCIQYCLDILMREDIDQQISLKNIRK